MCGINGILRFDGQSVDKDQLFRMNNKMVHRGPDDEGYFQDKTVGFSMRRLSIIDIKGGHQPISNEDGRYSIVLNGEIYNYLELRQELEAGGHRFKTKTDTEVLVHLYEEMGEKSLERLNGMFAFAIWDSFKREIFIANDRLGIKPLFYYQNSSFFCFSSELKSILTLNFDKNIDFNSLLLYLFLLYVPYPKSIVEGVSKLEPATYIKINESGRVIKQDYWRNERFNTIEKININEFKDKFLSILSDAVKLQLRSDVPVGTFLSGGIDSSSVVAMLSRLGNGNPIKTFSIGYEGHLYDERPYAQQVAKMYGTDHHEIFLTKGDVKNNFRRIIWFMDEPVGDSAALPTFMLSELARESGVKVILNGTGGDEIFGGYRRYLRNGFGRNLHNRLNMFTNIFLSMRKSPFSFSNLSKLNNYLLDYCSNIGGSYVGIRTFLKNDYWFVRFMDIFKGFQAEKFNTLNNLSEADNLMYFDLKTYLVGDLLFLLDKMTMGASIEGRVPLIDHRMAEFMFTVPARLKMEDGNLKSLVKKALKDILPDEILDRKKMGFGGPVSYWLSNDILNDINVFAEDASPVTKELFDMNKIGRTIRNKKYNRWNAQFIYNLAIFDLWYKDVFAVAKSS
ncbi:MAG: asparagine synthase (glutamine-hydrolyzing) [Ignavibacteriae bacterium]|nr:asparagine synthase (glutamine-hydrolyzing) [Ignavibacteriota bacterium]